ncbi:coiled-coil domain-containing protein 15 [Lissotriton helveticus]
MAPGPDRHAGCHGFQGAPAVKPRALPLVVNQQVLAGRTQAVRPVGAWVESGWDRWEEEGASRAVLSALHVEEELNKQEKDKQERLRRFQSEVKLRVNQQARLRKEQQLLRSYAAAQKEGAVVQQSTEAAGHLTPKRNTCLYRNNADLAICSPGAQWVHAQQLGGHRGGAAEEEGGQDGREVFQQQARALSKTMKHVRRSLVACKTVHEGESPSELPGGIWKVSPTRDKPLSRTSPDLICQEEKEEGLEGHHDLPAELHNQILIKSQVGKEDGGQSRAEPVQICNRLLKKPYPTGPAPAFSTDYRAALVLRPSTDLEDNKKQREYQYLMYRRLFMDIEREQVKEIRRQKRHEKRIAKIKIEKELHRHAEEQGIRTLAKLQDTHSGESESKVVAQLKEEERQWKVTQDKKRKNKENSRYIDALRAQTREKIQQHNIELPPLCCCGTDFWDSHPDTCANNCSFYRNHKAYTQALQSVIASYDLSEGNAVAKFSTRTISSARLAHSIENP